MGSVVLTNKVLEKYFGFLKDLDMKTKRSLIKKLTSSMDTKPKNEFDLRSIYGAWEDKRSSDEIISEIRSSRVEKVNTERFE